MKLISKDALVSIIDEKIKVYSKLRNEYPSGEDYYDGALDILEDFRDEFLNTLETKDVNMENVVIGEYDCDDDSSWISFDGWMLNYSFVGKKVKVIIVDESMEDKK